MKHYKIYKINFLQKKVPLIRYVITMIFLSGFCSMQVVAQKDTASKDRLVFAIVMHGKAYGDSIVLRWAPTDPVTWQMTMKKGYQILRVEYKENGSTDTISLNDKPILPQTLEEMKASARKDDEYMALAAQAMYGKNFTMESNDDNSGDFLKKIRSASDMFNMRYYFSLQVADLSREASNALGLRWVDNKVVKGRGYAYFIISDTANNKFGVASGQTKLMNNLPPQPLYPEGLEAFPSDKGVELHWYRRQAAGFTTYYVERSDDGGKTYKKLTDIPFQSIYNAGSENSVDSLERMAGSILQHSQVFMDSIPHNYVDYYYRIAGIDAFADISAYSPPVITHGVDLTPPKPVIIDSSINVFMNHMLITWVDLHKEGDLQGYYVARGDNVNGPFFPLNDKLLDKSEHHFIDTTASALQQNYYVVASVDTARNVSYSIPHIGILTDSIAPASPVGLEGVMDSLGFVGLRWAKNQEPDLAGYRIYISYNPETAFGIVTTYLVTDNYYLDSISTKSLDRRVYYKVVAVDRNGNHSEYSLPITINKPILIPPTAPVARKIFIQDAAVHIDWSGSSSEGVWGYEIYRREKKNETWATIALIPKNTIQPAFTYRDSGIIANTYYVYAAASIDSTGLRSDKSFAVQAIYHNMQILREPINVKAIYEKKNEGVKITWEAPADQGDYFFVVYHANGEGPMEILQSVGKNETSFWDYQAEKGRVYRYAIQIKQSGTNLTSGLSKEVSITP